MGISQTMEDFLNYKPNPIFPDQNKETNTSPALPNNPLHRTKNYTVIMEFFIKTLRVEMSFN